MDIEFRNTALVFCTIITSITAASRASLPVRAVTLSAQQAPGTPDGSSFTEFAVPLLNNAGHTAFAAVIGGPGVIPENSIGMWSEGVGALTLVARSGDQAPGAADGVRFGANFIIGNLNNSGSAVFFAMLDGPTLNNGNSIWLDDVADENRPVLVAMQGDSTPNSSGTYEFMGRLPALNDAGIVAMDAQVRIPFLTGHVTTDIIVTGNPDSGLREVIRGFSEPPGVLPPTPFFGLGPASINANGHLAFAARHSFQDFSDMGGWGEDGPGILKKIVRTGEPISPEPGSANFAEPYMPTLNDSGTVAFFSTLMGANAGSDRGIWRYSDASGLELVARTGANAPGTSTDISFGDLQPIVLGLNGAGQIVFSAALVGAGVDPGNDSGIWSDASGEMALLAREGFHTPDTPADVTFGSLYETSPTINARSRAVFSAPLVGAGVSPGVNDHAIFAEVGPGGSLIIVVRTGDSLEVLPGDFRTIRFLDFANFGGGPEDGRGSGFNDAGQVAFKATFTDGTSGIFVSVGDTDDDGFNDLDDNCVQAANSDQADNDGDGVGNACDNAPDHFNPGQENVDVDGNPDVNESTGEPTPLSAEGCGACGAGMSGMMATAFSLFLTIRRRDRAARKRFSINLCGYFAVIVLALTASASADTWDNSAGTAQWSTATNWADNSEPTINDPVIFPATVPSGGGIVNLSSNELASTLTLNNNYQLISGNLSLGGDNIHVANGVIATVATSLIGSGGLTKTGGGVLNLFPTVSNTFVGPVNISDGQSTLCIRSNSGLGEASNPVTINFGRLRIDGLINPNISMSRVITFGGSFLNEIQFVNNPIVSLFSGFGANSNPVSLAGTGTLIVKAASTRSGFTSVGPCTVRFDNGAGLGTGSISTTLNSILEISNGVTVTAPISLSSGAILRSAGGVGTYAGDCSTFGTVTLHGGANTGDVLQLGNGGASVYRSFDSTAITLVAGSGMVRTDVANDYSGSWQINSGVLRTGHVAGLGVGTSSIAIPGGTLQLGPIAFDRPVLLNGGRLALDAGGHFLNTVTIPPGTAAMLEARNTGNALLGDSPNALTGGTGGSSILVAPSFGSVLQLHQPSDYVGNWTLNGTVDVIADDNFGDAGNTVTLSSGGALQASIPVTLARTITPGFGTLKAVGPDTTLTLAAPLTSNNSILRSAGDGTVVVTAPSLRTGDTFIDQGSLRMTHAGALGTNSARIYVGQGMPPPGPSPVLEIADVTVSKPIWMDMNNGAIRGIGPNATTNSTVNVVSGRDVRLESGPAPTDTLTISGPPNNPLTGGGGQSSITVGGSGKVVLTRSSNYFGDWIIEEGTLEAGADNQLGASGTNISLAGGTLSTTATFSSGRSISANGGTIAPAALTTLTLNSALATTSGSLTKNGAGTLVLNTASARGGSTTINDGTVRVFGTTSGLGSGNVTINNGMLELNSVTYTGSTLGVILNSGALLRGFGNCVYSRSGFPTVENGVSLLSVGINVPGLADVLTIQSAFRDAVDATPSFATIVKQGNGKLILRAGGTSASDIFSGSWHLDGGILQIGPDTGGGEVLNALGFKKGDPRQANTITIDTGTLAVGAVNSLPEGPDFLRANLMMSGGSIASTNGINASYGGDFETTAASTSRVLVYDPASPITTRTVSLVGGAAGVNNLESKTVWGPGSRLIVDPGTNVGGTFNITRDGGTVDVVGSPILQINPGANVNLGGTLDVLSDGVDHVDVLNNANSIAFLSVIAGSKNVGLLGGSGKTSIAAGATLAAQLIQQNTLTVDGTAVLRLDEPGTPLSAISVVQQLNVTGTLGVTLGGTTAGTDFTQIVVDVIANLSGTLNIALAPGFDPAVGNSFVIMPFGSRIGTFNTVNGLEIGPGKEFSIQYNANDITLVVVVPTASGDMNCDDDSGTSDVDPFVLALTDPTQYAQQFPTCNPLNGDMNQDDNLDGGDIAQFINCLLNGGCP